jgi:hypothetical protein
MAFCRPEFLPSNVSAQPENQHASEAGIEREKNRLSSKVKIEARRKKSGHTRARRPEIGLEQPGRLRVAHLLALLGISHSTLYAGVKSGRYPSVQTERTELFRTGTL